MAIGFKFQYSGPILGSKYDDEGAIGFWIECQNKEKTRSYYIGDYKKNHYQSYYGSHTCNDDNYLYAIQVKSEPAQGGHDFWTGEMLDDMSLTNIKTWCKNPYNGIELSWESSGSSPSTASWTSAKACPMYYGVMGVQLKIEPETNGADDTALNQIILICEPILSYLDVSIDIR